MIFPSFVKFKQGMNIEMFIVRIIEAKKVCFFAKSIRGVLYIVSLLFRVIVSFKNLLYSCRILKEKEAKLPTVCVGNIVAGGVGKTPFVEMLVNDLALENTAVISRGYRSLGASRKNVLRPVDANYCGDEAFLLQRKMPKTLVLVSRNRKLAIDAAIRRGAEIAILDDGMQSRSLKKQVLIALVNAKDPFGKGYFLPRGYLRESPKALSRADYICVTNVESKKQYDLLFQELKKFTPAKIMGGKKQATGVCGQKSYSIEALHRKKVGAFCGLGDPGQFFEMLSSLHLHVVENKVLCDHKKLEEKALEDFIAKSKAEGAEFVLCTEKDYVKLDTERSYELPVCFLQIVFKVEYETKNYNDLLASTLKLTN
ncbi:tetraacyldisaccharide 4'-kinase [Candidatus Aerophobetes bacterium]|uniref:Tetraacyldisaccharide 4'-kinase n=1 Tax=Aerophobetes bacterium TaxID=2030807 RepID=A0A2A4YI69_UNCAE|nr:MAG: tetraacyldisaccharide 4'-kinase [Candidatus Aerophobetes bacterium]